MLTPSLGAGRQHHQTPFFIASRNGHLEVAKLLMDVRVDVDVRDEVSREPAVDGSVRGSDVSGCASSDGCAVGLDRQDQRTPLFVAAENGHAILVKLLLEARVDVDAREMVFTQLNRANQLCTAA